MAALVRLEWALPDLGSRSGAADAFAAVAEERRRVAGARGLVVSMWLRRGSRLGLVLLAESRAVGDAYCARATERVASVLDLMAVERSAHVVLCVVPGAGADVQRS
jgi:hypothetical protein